jgi:endoglucanase
MNKQLIALVVTMACLLMLPMAALAQLPTPTYGWNIGNTMEPPTGEGTWNNPPVTQALINSVAAAGFNTVRIPCAWNSHANQTTYQIDPAWMARVKQVVDYCYANNLHVVLDSHWDNGWLDSKITRRVDATINAKVNAYWTQIANAFATYDNRLLFACTNEPIAENAAEMSTLLTYEQTFVNAVRATGGNNASRWLVVQGPNTDIDLTFNLMNTLPNDPTPGRLMVEVHYYSPYNFTLMTADEQWGNQFYFWGQGYHSLTLPEHNPTWGEEDFLETQFQKMNTKFVSQGVPVLLGEFGAIKRTGNAELTGANLDLHIAARTYFYKEIVDTANSKGIKPVYWDNGWSGNDGFALIDRNSNAVIDADALDALTGGAALPPPSGGGGNEGTTMHVNSLVVTVTGNGAQKKGNATIMVMSNLGIPVVNATVTGNFTFGSFSEPGRTGVTDTNGVATIITNNRSGGSPSATFCVTNIAKSGLTYNPSGNVVTCDSN